jgi:hemolysin activation/secretion protein
MTYGRSGRALTAAIVGMGLGAAGGAAHAQSPGQTAGTPQQLNPGAQTEAASKLRRGDVFSAPESAPCPLRSSPLTFTLVSVEAPGAKTLDAADIRDAYQDLAGKEIPVGAICDIRDRVANMLFRRGVLARVEIPEQKIQDGKVRLEVIEAKIATVRYRAIGHIGPVQAKVEQYLEHLRGLAPFDLDTAQRYLLLANDLPGVHVTAHLHPSESAAVSQEAARGALDLDVDIERQAEDVVAAAQNLSSKTLGPWSGIARVDLNSFTRWGERTTLIGYSTLGVDQQQVVQIIEEARIGGGGMLARGSFAYGVSHPGDVLAPLRLSGRSEVGTGEIDYPLILLRRASVNLAGGFDWVDQRIDFPGGGALSDDSLRILWLRADGGVRHDGLRPTPLGYISTRAALSLQFRKGLDGLGASRAGAPSLSRNEGKPDAWVFRAEGQSSITFEPINTPGSGLTLSVHYQGQYADKPLLAYEEQPIGNLTVGRGYDPDALSGDRAFAAEFKSEVGPFWLMKGKKLGIAPYGFFDVAKVSNLDLGSKDRTVRSVGGGATFVLNAVVRSRPGAVTADLAYAKPLDKPFAAALAKPPARVLFQINVSY